MTFVLIGSMLAPGVILSLVGLYLSFQNKGQPISESANGAIVLALYDAAIVTALLLLSQLVQPVSNNLWQLFPSDVFVEYSTLFVLPKVSGMVMFGAALIIIVRRAMALRRWIKFN